MTTGTATRVRLLWLLLLSVLLAPALLPDCSFAQEAVAQSADGTRHLADPGNIRPADVLARVEQLRANVDRLRRYMGKPSPSAPLLQTMSAQPNVVYSQALNLLLRANRLAFEQVRVLRDEPERVPSELHPLEILRIVDSALSAVLLVTRNLKIEAVVVVKSQPVSTTHADVFNATITASTEIDQLLESRTSPSDVFQLVTAAVHTAASLHATIPRGPMLPNEPRFEPNKTPGEVLLRLRHCLELIEQISATKGMKILVFEEIGPESNRVAPKDVSDVASLLVEELRDLHARFPAAREPALSHYPGRRFPAHVYQRAGLLERLLVDLAEAYTSGADPEVLSASGGS